MLVDAPHAASNRTDCEDSVRKPAASTDVIARQMLWKVPRKVGGILNFKMLLLTRMGEALFRYLRLRGFENSCTVPATRCAAT